MVYTALTAALPMMMTLAVFGGLISTALSAKPPRHQRPAAALLIGFLLPTPPRPPVARSGSRSSPWSHRQRARPMTIVILLLTWNNLPARLGFALAMDRHERGRRGGDAGAVFSSTRLNHALGYQPKLWNRNEECRADREIRRGRQTACSSSTRSARTTRNSSYWRCFAPAWPSCSPASGGADRTPTAIANGGAQSFPHGASARRPGKNSRS